jgi:glucokinase
MTRTIGIDVGGTKVAAGVVDIESGTVLRLIEQPTRADLGGRSVLDLCGGLIAELNGDGLPVGIGLCELIDRDGHIRSGVTVDWQHLDIEAALGPVALESDVRAAALAEARFGAGRGRDNFLYLSIGTGVAHTLVLAGKPYPGAHGYAIMVGAPPIEHTSSGAALATAAGTDTHSVLADAAHASLVESASRLLGQALASLIHAFDPGVVIIGGGLGLNSKYRSRIAAATKANLATKELTETPILAAELGKSAGIVGAALIAASSD